MADKKATEKTPEKTEEVTDKAGGTDLQTTGNAGSTEVAPVGADDDDFFASGGEGLEDFEQSDYLIPYVRIIQALSKELQKNHAKYKEGAEQSMFINSATRKIYSGEKGFLIVPVKFGHRYMAWRPNNAGPAYDMGDDPKKFNAATPDEKGKRFDSEGNQLTDALQYFVLLVEFGEDGKPTGEFEQAVLNFTGSQAKKGRGLVSTIGNRMERYPAGHPKAGTLFKPAVYFYSYKVTTVPESNDQGSWYGFSIEEGPKVMDLPNGREIFAAAKVLRGMIEAGEVRAAAEEPEAEAEEEKAF